MNEDYRKKLTNLGINRAAFVNDAEKSDFEKLKRLEKRLDDINASNLDIESNLKKKLDKVKTQLEMAEFKFNEENLKKIKLDVDKLNTNMNEKVKMLKKDHDDIMGIFETSNRNDLLTNLENELKESSAYEQVYKELNSIFHTNVVRPASNVSNTQSTTESTTENEEFFNCRSSQKSIYKIF